MEFSTGTEEDEADLFRKAEGVKKFNWTTKFDFLLNLPPNVILLQNGEAEAIEDEEELQNTGWIKNIVLIQDLLAYIYNIIYIH